jgi:hypothetical protein
MEKRLHSQPFHIFSRFEFLARAKINYLTPSQIVVAGDGAPSGIASPCQVFLQFISAFLDFLSLIQN